MPPEWDGQTHRIARKDLDACWAKMRRQTYYGYKNHINADQEYTFIREYTVTDAAIHDLQVFDDVIDPLVQDRECAVERCE